MSHWQGKSVLVTGGMGFIGSHLCERLVDSGARVRVLGRYNSSGKLGWLEKSHHVSEIECRLGDVRDAEMVARLVRGCEVVFHLAALIGIPYSYEAPRSYVQTNIEGTLNVLLACREHGATMVHTSTSEVYGTALQVPITEQHPLQGQSPYSASKIGADQMVESFYRSFQVPVMTIRPFNTFGPRQSQRAVIPTIIAQGLRDQVIHLGSLTPTRDFNFVDNTVDGFLAAAAQKSALGQTINLSSSKEISVGDLVLLIGDLLGKKLLVKTEDERTRPEKSEVQRLLGDHSLARKLLDWSPRVGLREGLQRTIEWMRQHRELYEPAGYAT